MKLNIIRRTELEVTVLGRNIVLQYFNRYIAASLVNLHFPDEEHIMLHRFGLKHLLQVLCI